MRGSSYCVCGGEIKSVSDAAKITNMVMTEMKLFRERQVGFKDETEIFGRQAGQYELSGREGEGLTMLEVC